MRVWNRFLPVAQDTHQLRNFVDSEWNIGLHKIMEISEDPE